MSKSRYWLLNPKAKKIAQSIKEHPEQWTFDSAYRLSNKAVTVWVGHGWWFIGLYKPHEEKLGLIGRTIVYFAIKKLLLSRRQIELSENEKAISSLDS